MQTISFHLNGWLRNRFRLISTTPPQFLWRSEEVNTCQLYRTNMIHKFQSMQQEPVFNKCTCLNTYLLLLFKQREHCHRKHSSPRILTHKIKHNPTGQSCQWLSRVSTFHYRFLTTNLLFTFWKIHRKSHSRRNVRARVKICNSESLLSAGRVACAVSAPPRLLMSIIRAPSNKRQTLGLGNNIL